MRALRFVYLVSGLFLVVTAGFVAYSSWQGLQEAMASSHWPSVPGRITSSGTVILTGRHGSEGADIHYTYAVGAKRFNGSRLEVVDYSANTSHATDAVAEFQEGRDVPVYYDPARPERSVLRPGATWFAYTLPVLAVVMVLFGIALVRLFLRLQAAPSFD